MATFKEVKDAMNLFYHNGVKDNMEMCNDEVAEEDLLKEVEDYETFYEGLNKPLCIDFQEIDFEKSKIVSEHNEDLERDEILKHVFQNEEEEVHKELDWMVDNDQISEHELPVMIDASEEVRPHDAAAVKPVKRRISKSDQKKSPSHKIAEEKTKHPMLPPCSCKKKCTDRIEEEERKVIYHQLWENDYNGRLAWLHS